MFTSIKKSINLKTALFSVLLSGMLILDTINAFAIRIPVDMNTQIIFTTNKLEEILKDKYEEKLEQIKDDVLAKNLDYNLTMQSLTEKGNVFSDADYIKLIAAYITVSNNKLSVVDIDFFKEISKVNSITEKKPYKYYEYKKNKNGTYDRGAVKYLITDDYVGEYKRNDDGTYSYVGKRYITLEDRAIKYLDLTINLISPEELLANYGRGYEKEATEYESRLEMLKAAGVSARGLRESIMLILYHDIQLSNEENEALQSALLVGDENRRAIIATAASLLGKVPYQWGGKSKISGYDTDWWTFNESGEQIGLDCSGYVEWVYRTCGYSKYNLLTSTGTILHNTVDISESELMPGDIGVLNHGETTNHTGIYLGNGYFIHCSSSKDTVVISKFPFTVFKRATDLDQEVLSAYEYIDDNNYAYTPDDVMLLSKLVAHEGAGEGLNGWVGICEVVMNRVNSPLFPDNIYDVVYQGSDQGAEQFSHSDEIELIEPSENIVSVVEATLSGKIKVLNNPNVLYFRNPYEEDMNDWGSHVAYTRINNHVFYEQ